MVIWSMTFQDVAGAASQRLLSYKYDTPSVYIASIVTSHIIIIHHFNFMNKITWCFPLQVRGQPKYKHGGGAAWISWDRQPGELHLHVPCLTPLFHQIQFFFLSIIETFSGVVAWSPILGSVRSCRASSSSHLKTLANIQVWVKHNWHSNLHLAKTWQVV